MTDVRWAAAEGREIEAQLLVPAASGTHLFFLITKSVIP